MVQLKPNIRPVQFKAITAEWAAGGASGLAFLSCLLLDAASGLGVGDRPIATADREDDARAAVGADLPRVRLGVA